MTIETITSRQILDSRGRPTLETTVYLDAGVSGTAAVPSGASTGSHEALELRDGDQGVYAGLGVKTAISHVTGPIAKALKGLDVRQQAELDQRLIELDGTVNKSNLGANATLSVSMAAARAAAALQKLPLYRWLAQAFEGAEPVPDRLPRPMMNVLNGGKHADTDLAVQEFLLLPSGATTAEQVERGVVIYWQLGRLLAAKHLRTTVGDEGGYAPAIKDPAVALDFLTKAIAAADLRAPDDVALGLDIAASELFDPVSKRYALGQTSGGLAAEGVISLLREWVSSYPIQTIEDPLAEDDWEGWQTATAALGGTVKLIGDDVFVTNVSRLQRGIDSRAANGILLKPNQVGTLTETVKAADAAREAGYTLVASHRSGETTDSFIADLAVAIGADFLKAGAPARGERVAKYNRLLAIAEELGA